MMLLKEQLSLTDEKFRRNGLGCHTFVGAQGRNKGQEAKETFSTLQELSQLLNTGLDSQSLSLCVRLCEQGAHPEALATIIRELRRESQAIKAAAASSSGASHNNNSNKENHY